MAAVSNCSPLRYFIAIGRADLLPGVLGQIAIPEAVFRELTHPSAPESVRKWMENIPEWLSVKPVVNSPLASLSEILDAGECEAIQLALDLPPDFILIDERRGRREAELAGLKTIGALGVLVEAHRLGLLADPMQELSRLQSHGFRVSRRLVEEFRRQIGL